MKTADDRELRAVFREGLHKVAEKLNTYPTKVTKEEYKKVCLEEGIRYIDPLQLGGFTKVKDQLRAEGELKITKEEELDYKDEQDKTERAKREICILMFDYIKRHGYIPTLKEAQNALGYKINKFYPTMEAVYSDIVEKFPEVTRYTFNESVFASDEYLEDVRRVIKNNKRFFITAAVSNTKVDVAFVNSIKTYAKEKDAVVLVIPIITPNKSSLYQCDLDPALKDFYVVTEQVDINSNLTIWDMKVNPRQIKSINGLSRAVAHLDSSIIAGDTKQRIEYVPTHKDKIPHMSASTGCCTINSYNSTGLLTNKSTKLAELMHKIGGLIIEKEDDDIYHCRNVEAGPKGEFIDLGKEYSIKGVKTVKGSVMVMGDLHVPKHNKRLLQKHLELIPQLHIDTVVLHDAVNMGAVTHHDKGKVCLSAVKTLKGQNTIEFEANELKEVLEGICKVTKNVIIPFSNHPEHLDRYLEEGRFIYDPSNFYISLDLAKAYIEGKNVLEYLMVDKMGLKAKNIKWLDKDEYYSVYNTVISEHGDSRVNGMRGSMRSVHNALGRAVIGHQHTPKIDEEVVCVGISCDKNQGYNSRSFSSWLNSSAIIYPNGTIQKIDFLEIDDKYKCEV